MWWKRRDGGSNEPSAQELFERGASLLETDLDSARRCYERAVELEPGFSGAWFDLGLTHKWRREWIDTLACNRRAIDVQEEPEEGDPAFWNAGIAATALHDWASARWAWRGYGIPIDDGDGEIVADFGLGVVRLPSGETVWCRRIDPTRMKVLSVPLPESGFRCRDILLHDGAPEGTRVAFGREYSVMAFIEMWAATDVPTTEILVDASGSAVDDLIQANRAG